MYKLGITVLQLIFYFTSILNVAIFAQDYYEVCLYGTANKPVGNFKYESGKTNISSFYSYHSSSIENCNFGCLTNENCLATSFVDKNCSFYNTSDFYVVLGPEIQYSKWVKCDTKNGYQPGDGRCEGLWVTYMSTFINITYYPFLDSIHDKPWNCRKLCLENPLCGFINRFDGECSFVPQWPVNNIIINNTNINFTMDKWTCVDGFYNNLEIEKQIIKPIEMKCSGFWEIISHNFTIAKSSSYGLYFQTQIYKNCLDECNQYSNCSVALYSFEYSFCILENIENSIYNLPSKHISFIKFHYKCVKNDIRYPRLNKDEKRYQQLKMDCFKIEDTNKLFIAEDECGKFPLATKFAECNGQMNEKWTKTDSCLQGQIYWAFPEESINININGNNLVRKRKIFTGLQSYWLLYSGNNLVRVNYLQCRHFNASRSTERLQHSEIVYRKQWQALPPNGTVNSFQTKPKNFLISASQRPYHSCKTKAACIDVLRTMQVSYYSGAGSNAHLVDIPYNFLIDESGTIYECSGWHNENAANAPYSSNTISIAFIGYFKYALPNENVLNSIKKLIEYGIRNKFVHKDYNLYNVGDLSTHHTSKNIVNVIKNFYRYKGFLPNDCSTISLLIILINLLICVLVYLFFIYFFYIMLGYKHICKTCKFLDPDLKWCKIFPSDLDIIQPSLQPSNISQNSKQHYIIHENSTILSSKSHRNTIKMIKLWFFNQLLETVNSHCSGNNLSNYLNKLLKIESKTVVYETNMRVDSNENLFSKVVLVVNIDNNLTFYKSLIYNRSCICHYFSVEQFDITNLIIDIPIRSEYFPSLSN